MKKILITLLLSALIYSSQGQIWTVYSKDNSPLPSDRVKSITCDKADRIWIATDSGLVRKNEENWTIFTTFDQLPYNSINSILIEDSPGEPKIWVSTNRGAARLTFVNDNLIGIEKFSRTNSGLASDSVWLLSVDCLNNIWFANQAGVSVFNNSEWYFKTSSNNESVLTNVSSIAPFSDGWNLLGTRGTGVARMKMDVDGVTGASSYVQNYTGLWSDNILCVYIDSLDNQWIGTDRGMSHHLGFETLEGWNEPAYRRSTHNISDTVYAIKGDDSGRLWLATPTGLVVLSDSVFSTFTVTDGLPADLINDITFDTDGNIWIATEKGIAKASADKVLISGIQHRIVINNGRLTKVYPTIASYLVTTGFSLNSKSNSLFLQVLNSKAQIVNTLYSGSLSAGNYSMTWGCDDENGRKVPQGMYFIILKTKSGIDCRKVIVQ